MPDGLSLIKKYPEWTSSQGLNLVTRSSKWYCIGFWAVLTLAFFGVMLWQCILLIINYYSYPYSVQISLQFEERVFPAVTLCNLNPYKQSVVRNYPSVMRLMDTYAYVMEKVACELNPSCSFTANSTLDEYQVMYGLNDITDTASLQTKARRLLSIEIAQYDITPAIDTIGDFIQGCSFNLKDCDMENHWTPYIDPIMGSCFMFNKDSQLMAKRAGPIYGLRLVLKTNISEFIATSDATGMRVMVHDQKEFPYPDIFGYNIQVGRSTQMGQEVIRLGPPYSECTNVKPDNYLYDRDYSNEGCQRSRYQDEMVANCSCYDPQFPRPNNTDAAVCKIPDDFECWNSQTNASRSDNSCTQPCNEGLYKVIVSSAKWPGPGTMIVGNCVEGMYAQSCVETFRENGAQLEIFYEKLNYELMEENVDYPVASLLSDFGGQSGLWLAWSAVTVIEIFVVDKISSIFGCFDERTSAMMTVVAVVKIAPTR
ncbi:DEG-1 protein [Aphelenchoides avenae]|nr:DEG-1 protein [Aphelenchus avenae]